MKRLMFLLIGLQLSFVAIAYPQNITVVTPPNVAPAISPDSVKKVVQQDLQQLKLSNGLVKIFYTKEPGTFIFAKLSRFTYKVSFLLVKYDGKSMTVQDSNFVPRAVDFGLYSNKSNLKEPSSTTSSETTYDFAFDTPTDDIPTAVSAINTVSGYATNLGYTVDKMIGSQATMSAIENAITGNDIIAMGNIGHGSTDGILLYDGFLDYTWFGGQNLSGKVFFFNSCEVANDPMYSAMLNTAHARTFAGGLLDLPIGTSELVFQDFWNYTLNDGSQMGAALSSAEANHGLQNYYRIGGDLGMLVRQVAASISGPTNLSENQAGTYTCTAHGGAPPYDYQWWKEENGVPVLGPVSALTISPDRPAPGNWYQVGTNSATLQSSDITSFSLKCIVTDAIFEPNTHDSNDSTTSDIFAVGVSGSQNALSDRPGADAAVIAALPEEDILGQNYPNPFNPTTQIQFALSKPARVRLVVYDMLGREVAKLADGEMAAGYHSVTWNASGVSSGVYIYRLTAGNFVQTRRMLLMK